MTRRRLRWLAVQSVVVTALAVVVVLTLLKPESNSPLSGISGGSETTPTIAQGPTGANQGGPNHGAPDNGNADHKPGDDQTTPGDGATAATGSASGTPAPVSPPPAASPIAPGDDTEGDSPTIDQYADTLGRLDAALN